MSVVSMKSNQGNKIHKRFAFCGSMGSGKSYTSRTISDNPKWEGNCKVLSLATPIKEIAANMNQTSRAAHIMVGMAGREIDGEVWVKKLRDKINSDSYIHRDIIVDDVRFLNEVQMLKEEGFTIIYLKTPWHIRFKRVKLRCGENFEDLQYFNNESEIACESIPLSLFDHVWETPAQIDEGVNNILESI